MWYITALLAIVRRPPETSNDLIIPILDLFLDLCLVQAETAGTCFRWALAINASDQLKKNQPISLLTENGSSRYAEPVLPVLYATQNGTHTWHAMRQ